MVTYRYYKGRNDEYQIYANSLEGIRAKFIKEEGKDRATTIFCTDHPVGRIWYRYGMWIYSNYEKNTVHQINEKGKIVKYLGVCR